MYVGVILKDDNNIVPVEGVPHVCGGDPQGQAKL